MADVVCLVILVADIFGSPIASLPAAGELALLDRYLLSVGGCAANTAADLGHLLPALPFQPLQAELCQT